MVGRCLLVQEFSALTKTLIALAIAVIVIAPVFTSASAQNGGGVGVGGFDGWGQSYGGWGNGCLVWRRGVDYFGKQRLVKVNTCY